MRLIRRLRQGRAAGTPPRCEDLTFEHELMQTRQANGISWIRTATPTGPEIPPGPFGFFRGRTQRGDAQNLGVAIGEHGDTRTLRAKLQIRTISSGLVLFRPDGHVWIDTTDSIEAEIALQYAVLCRTDPHWRYVLGYGAGRGLQRQLNWQVLIGRELYSSGSMFFPERWKQLHAATKRGRGRVGDLDVVRSDEKSSLSPWPNMELLDKAARLWDEGWGGPLCENA